MRSGPSCLHPAASSVCRAGARQCKIRLFTPFVTRSSIELRFAISVEKASAPRGKLPRLVIRLYRELPLRASAPAKSEGTAV